MIAHPDRLVRLPDNLTDEDAVLIDSLAAALHPVMEHLPPDDAVVMVYGAGIIGQHTIRVLRHLNCRAKIIAVARYPLQEALAQAGGADVVLVKPSRRELGEAVGARWLPTTLGGGNFEGGANFFFDCAGGQQALQDGLLLLCGQGTYVLMATSGSVKGLDLSSVWFRELHLTGSAMYAFGQVQGRRVHTYKLAVDFLASGTYPMEGLVTHVYPLSEYRQAFQTAMDKGRRQSRRWRRGGEGGDEGVETPRNPLETGYQHGRGGRGVIFRQLSPPTARGQECCSPEPAGIYSPGIRFPADSPPELSGCQ